MPKNYKDINYKESIKSNIGRVSKIMELKRSNPNLLYAQVRVDEDYDPDGTNFESYVLNGWDVVVDTTGVSSDYSQLEKKDSNKPVVLEQKGRGRAHFVWMSIPKDKFRANEKARIERDKASFIKSTKAKGGRVSQKGNNLRITDPEVNSENYNDQSDKD